MSKCGPSRARQHSPRPVPSASRARPHTLPPPGTPSTLTKLRYWPWNNCEVRPCAGSRPRESKGLDPVGGGPRTRSHSQADVCKAVKGRAERPAAHPQDHRTRPVALPRNQLHRTRVGSGVRPVCSDPFLSPGKTGLPVNSEHHPGLAPCTPAARLPSGPASCEPQWDRAEKGDSDVQQKPWPFWPGGPSEASPSARGAATPSSPPRAVKDQGVKGTKGSSPCWGSGQDHMPPPPPSTPKSAARFTDAAGP